MKNVLLFLPLFFLSLVGFSQTPGENEIDEMKSVNTNRHGLGAAAGMTSAYGLSYRYYHNPMIFQVTFSPLVTGSKTVTNTGLTLMWKLVESPKTSFFVYQSNFLKYSARKYTYNYYYNSVYSHTEEDISYNMGLGFGLEYIAADRVSFSLMTGYGAFENFNTFSLSVEGGIFYLF